MCNLYNAVTLGKSCSGYICIREVATLQGKYLEVTMLQTLCNLYVDEFGTSVNEVCK